MVTIKGLIRIRVSARILPVNHIPGLRSQENQCALAIQLNGEEQDFSARQQNRSHIPPQRCRWLFL